MGQLEKLLDGTQGGADKGFKGVTPPSRPTWFSNPIDDIHYDGVKKIDRNNSPLDIASDNLDQSKYSKKKPYTNPEQ